jgi:GTP-binding protein
MRFIDQVIIDVAAGKGGPGCVAFRREPYVPRGGPVGGDGGKGGDVVLLADANVGTLLDFRYRRKYRAKNGRPGEGAQKTGAGGEEVLLNVPCGTLVYDDVSGELLGDMVEDGERLVIATGGKGGRGNYRFRSATHQAPRRSDGGMPGQELRIRLELKLLADIGLVGFPNAGKSTLLSSLTSARPKIADYPFTTLVPNLGIMDLGDYLSCTIADIPGLIEGAADGKGLGHAFLRHVERTRLLIFLLDINDEPAARYAALLEEVGKYAEALGQARHLVCFNKMDLWLEEEELPSVPGADAILCISAVTRQGLDDLKARMKLELSALDG